MNTPQLGILMSAYYHQDWVELGMWETLDLYLSDSTGADIRQLALDLEVALRLQDEGELEHFISTSGGCIYLRDEPGGYRGFFEELARRVGASLAA